MPPASAMRARSPKARNVNGHALAWLVVATGGALGAILLAGPAPAMAATYPTKPPVRVCGNRGLLRGPATAPRGAVTVPAGDNSSLDPVANTTYWFAPGTHTLGRGEFDQIIPADGDVFIGGPGAVLDGQRVNRYAFTQHARNVTVEYLTIQNFGAVGANHDEGVVNHDSGHGWRIHHNTVRRNAGAGVFLGTGNVVRFNCLTANGQYGFSGYEAGGDAHVILDRNEISYNNTYDWDKHVPGCGCAGGGKFWNVNGATITGNWVHHNKGPGLWADTDNNDFDFERNYLERNDGEGIEYEISYNARIKHNTFIRNALVDGPGNPGFPTGAIYLSESGGDPRVPARFSTIEVAGNRFVDNWSGVVMWENADRFCGSAANTSSDYCTLGNPSVANLSTCAPGTIAAEPYRSDCRWKTQNVSVHHNRFVLSRRAIRGCMPSVSCGLQGLFSNSGTYPSWSPYMGDTIERAITFEQNNRFAQNTYRGPWRFMAQDQSTVLSARAWRTAPYRQDRRSRFADMR